MTSVDIRSWFIALLRIYELLVFSYAVMSWFTGLGPTARSIHSFLATICEPYVGLVRRLLPRQITGASGVDLTPLVAILLLIVVQGLVR
ncbi:MAG: YggT family protein [Coriobacteriia bacterium]|nr:YggT family protein [Coriobacteriia bacterium]